MLIKWNVLCVLSEESLPVNVFCGVVAGIVSSSFANPTDVLKVCISISWCKSDCYENIHLANLVVDKVPIHAVFSDHHTCIYQFCVHQPLHMEWFRSGTTRPVQPTYFQRPTHFSVLWTPCLFCSLLFKLFAKIYMYSILYFMTRYYIYIYVLIKRHCPLLAEIPISFTSMNSC